MTDTQDKTPRPTVDFDHHSQEFADDWRAVTNDLRTKCPVAWTEAHGGYWVVSRYEDVKAVALDDTTFSSDNDMTGVPALVFAEKYLVMGAQPLEVLKQVVEQVKSEA